MLNHTRTVVLLGDSISVGTFPFLKQQLEHENGRTLALVVAKVGAPTAWMRSMFGTVLGMNPTDVLIMGGTNDIAGGGSSAEGAAINNLLALRSALSAEGIRVLVSTIPPRTDDQGRLRTAHFNEVLSGVMPVVDVGGRLSPGLIGGDHVHPTATGYWELGARWAGALEEPSALWGLVPLVVGVAAASAVRRW